MDRFAGAVLTASRIFSVGLTAQPERRDMKEVSFPLDVEGGGAGTMGVSSSGSLYQSIALASFSLPSDPSAHDILAAGRVKIEPVVAHLYRNLR